MERGVLSPEEYFSHEFRLEQIDQAYETFYTKRDNALKVLIRP
jgi:alcohol dehydrogenase